MPLPAIAAGSLLKGALNTVLIAGGAASIFDMLTGAGGGTNELQRGALARSRFRGNLPLDIAEVEAEGQDRLLTGLEGSVRQRASLTPPESAAVGFLRQESLGQLIQQKQREMAQVAKISQPTAIEIMAQLEAMGR